MPRANSFSDSILSQPNQPVNWSIFPRVLAEPYKIEEVVPARQRVSRGNLPRDLALCAFFSNSSTLAGHFSRAPLAFPLPVLAFEPVEGTSNDRKRVFRAVAAASSVVEWIFLAFPLAAGVTRLRLKYLLVDFATMGTDSLFLFLFPLDTLRHRGPRKIHHPEKKFYVTFPLRSPSPTRLAFQPLVYLLLFISTDFNANFLLFSPSRSLRIFPTLLLSLRVGKFWLDRDREKRIERQKRDNRRTELFRATSEKSCVVHNRWRVLDESNGAALYWII